MKRLTAIIAAAVFSAVTVSAQTSRLETFLADSLDHTQELISIKFE